MLCLVVSNVVVLSGNHYHLGRCLHLLLLKERGCPFCLDILLNWRLNNTLYPILSHRNITFLCLLVFHSPWKPKVHKAVTPKKFAWLGFAVLEGLVLEYVELCDPMITPTVWWFDHCGLHWLWLWHPWCCWTTRKSDFHWFAHCVVNLTLVQCALRGILFFCCLVLVADDYPVHVLSVNWCVSLVVNLVSHTGWAASEFLMPACQRKLVWLASRNGPVHS